MVRETTFRGIAEASKCPLLKYGTLVYTDRHPAFKALRIDPRALSGQPKSLRLEKYKKSIEMRQRHRLHGVKSS